jgi:hypothetical protein
MAQNPFDRADSSVDIKEHDDRLELYVGQHGHVCIRQTKVRTVDSYPVVAIDPRNVNRLIELLHLAAEHAPAKHPGVPTGRGDNG